MIYTLTFNPALDYVMEIKTLNEGRTNRSKSERVYFGGKGINVSVILSRLGVKNKALGFVAGFTGKELLKMLKKEKVKTDFIMLRKGMTRINVKLKGVNETEINSSGPEITADDISKLFNKLDKLKKGDILVLSGSIPPSVPQNIYEEIIKRVSQKSVKAVIDSEKDTLLLCLKYRPFLIKPNKHELEEIAGKSLESTDEIIGAAKELKVMGAENVLVSLGKNGAVLIDESGHIHTEHALGGNAVNTVGAGDSMVAGFLAGVENGYNYALRLALSAGGATATSEHLATKEKIDELFRI